MVRIYARVGRRTTVRVGCLGTLVLWPFWLVGAAISILTPRARRAGGAPPAAAAIAGGALLVALAVGIGLAVSRGFGKTASPCAQASAAYQEWGDAWGPSVDVDLQNTDQLRQALSTYKPAAALENAAQALYADLADEAVQGTTQAEQARVQAAAAAVEQAASQVPACT